MSNTLSKTKKEKTLSEERYDEKLFKQAYKAALKTKEIEKKNDKKKRIFRIVYVFLAILAIPLSTAAYLSFRPIHFDSVESLSPSSSQKAIFSKVEIDTVERASGLTVQNVKISSKSALVFDPDNGSILFEKNVEEKRAVASLTKLITALVILDNFDMESQVEVSNKNLPGDIARQLDLKEGYTISVRDLFESILISSYNDAAYIAANAYPFGGYDEFVGEMNKKAEDLGMNSSHFSNPAGLDEAENYSTAKDISRLVSAAINRTEILNTVKKGAAIISWKEGSNGVKSKTVYTTNQLYDSNNYIQGLKTGVTKDADECFTGYFLYPNSKRVVTVVLGSSNRFGDTQVLESAVRSILLK